MKYFKLVKANIPTQPLLDEIDSVDKAWALNEGRQQKIAVQREAQSIPIRGLVSSAINGKKRRDVHPSRYTSISKRFVRTRAFLETMATALDAELGRAKLVRLVSGHTVYPHRDRGLYYQFRDRYHLVIKSEGSYLKSGDEEVTMNAGELWWFDNKQIHEAHNNHQTERIHLIFDLLPNTGIEGDHVQIREAVAVNQ